MDDPDLQCEQTKNKRCFSNIKWCTAIGQITEQSEHHMSVYEKIPLSSQTSNVSGTADDKR
jgi:hypothetical protein